MENFPLILFILFHISLSVVFILMDETYLIHAVLRASLKVFLQLALSLRTAIRLAVEYGLWSALRALFRSACTASHSLFHQGSGTILLALPMLTGIDSRAASRRNPVRWSIWTFISESGESFV